jgi:hypothetical protein
LQVVWNRKLAVPAWNYTSQGTVVTIQTSALTLTYDSGTSGGFSPENLAIRVNQPSFWTNNSVWRPGMTTWNDPGNLEGTFHTLDTLSGWQDLNCSLHDPLYQQQDVM